METIVSLGSLTHDYGNHIALDQLDVDVPAGVTGLVGANGCLLYTSDAADDRPRV